MIRTISMAALGLVLMTSLAVAKKEVEKVVVADTAPKFELLVEKIHDQMGEGERYEFMSKRDRQTVDLSFKKMAALLTASGSVEAMNSDERMKLFNEQEKVNGLLARNADDRLVCTHVAPAGSHIPVKSCRTAREINMERNNSRRDMQNMTNDRLNLGRGN